MVFLSPRSPNFDPLRRPTITICSKGDSEDDSVKKNAYPQQYMSLLKQLLTNLVDPQRPC